MRPRPLFQSLPVFTCFDRGLRFFVSKLCPNSLGYAPKTAASVKLLYIQHSRGRLSGHARHR